MEAATRKLLLPGGLTVANFALQLSGSQNPPIALALFGVTITCWTLWAISHQAVIIWCVRRRYMSLAALVLLGALIGGGGGAAWWTWKIKPNQIASPVPSSDGQRGTQAPPAIPPSQTTTGPNSPLISGNNNTVTYTQSGDPKINAKLDEIKRLILAQQGNKAAPEKLLDRYPFGYVIYDIDNMNSVLPYRNEALTNWRIDWSVAKIQEKSPAQIIVTAPGMYMRDSRSNVSLDGISIVISKEVGPFHKNFLKTGSFEITGEIMAIRDKGIVFLIGVRPPSVNNKP
jgi:hypothetical protein